LQATSTLTIFLYLFIKKGTRPTVGTTLETKLKIIADSEAAKRAGNVGRELGIPLTTVRTAADKQKYRRSFEKTDDSQPSTSAL
jgi:hypothetical protein